jgi:hypothetical protein
MTTHDGKQNVLRCLLCKWTKKDDLTLEGAERLRLEGIGHEIEAHGDHVFGGRAKHCCAVGKSLETKLTESGGSSVYFDLLANHALEAHGEIIDG